MGVSVGCRGRAVLGTYIEMLARAAAAAAAARRYRVTSYPLTQLSLGLQVILDEADLVLQREQKVITRVISLTQHTAHSTHSTYLESGERGQVGAVLDVDIGAAAAARAVRVLGALGHGGHVVGLRGSACLPVGRRDTTDSTDWPDSPRYSLAVRPAPHTAHIPHSSPRDLELGIVLPPRAASPPH